MMEYIRRLMRQSRDIGATAVEYALMVAAIAAVVGVAAFALGGATSSSLEGTTDCIKTHGPTCTPSNP